jgi:hypothetical protein
MLMGHNTNVPTSSGLLHVQTEDLGLESATIVTHVFGPGGNVLKVEQYDYRKHIENPRLPELLPRALRARHDSVVRRLLAEDGGAPSAELAPEPTPVPVLEQEFTPMPTPLALVAVPEPPTGSPEEAPGDPPPAELGWDQVLARTQQASAKPRVPWDDVVRARRAAGEPSSSPGRTEETPNSDEYVVDPDERADRKDPALAAQEAYEEGHDHLKRRDVVASLSMFALAVHLQPDDHEYRRNLLKVLARLD